VLNLLLERLASQEGEALREAFSALPNPDWLALRQRHR
jgi:hypothetical protein